MEDFFLPVIFLCFFAIWNPVFWSEFSWPTVGFLLIFSQFLFQKRDLNSGGCFLYLRIVGFADNFLRINE